MEQTSVSSVVVANARKFRIITLLLISLSVIAVIVIFIVCTILVDSAEFRVVNERSDIISLEPTFDAPVDLTYNLSSTPTFTASHKFDDSDISSDELWNEESIIIYATPDTDICVNGSLSGLGDMYWQTSNPSVIAGFYDSARTWLNFDDGICRYPLVTGEGSTIITAGTYDGKRRDSIMVTVVNPSDVEWEREVLKLVNQIRVENNLPELVWSENCEQAALVRATEIKTLYSHTRPDGTNWSTACPSPTTDGASGENLAMGNAATSPAAVVALWMSSEAHRANILNPTYTKLAVGFVFDMNSDYKTYWAQFFSTY